MHTLKEGISVSLVFSSPSVAKTFDIPLFDNSSFDSTSLIHQHIKDALADIQDAVDWVLHPIERSDSRYVFPSLQSYALAITISKNIETYRKRYPLAKYLSVTISAIVTSPFTIDLNLIALIKNENGQVHQDKHMVDLRYYTPIQTFTGDESVLFRLMLPFYHSAESHGVVSKVKEEILSTTSAYLDKILDIMLNKVYVDKQTHPSLYSTTHIRRIIDERMKSVTSVSCDSPETELVKVEFSPPKNGDTPLFHIATTARDTLKDVNSYPILPVYETLKGSQLH